MQTTRETVITRDNRSLSLFLPFTPVSPSRDTARALFYKPGVEIERVGVSISRRLLIHDYRPPRRGIQFRNAKWRRHQIAASSLGVYSFFSSIRSSLFPVFFKLISPLLDLVISRP